MSQNIGNLTALANAEQNLIASVGAATERLDAVGTTDLDDALLQLHVAANLARQRLDAALGRVGELVGGVVGSLRASADRLAADLAGSLRGIVPQPAGQFPGPAPESAPIPSPEDLRDADSPEPEGGSIDLSSPAPRPPEDAPESAATPPESSAEPVAAEGGERVERAANPPSEGEPAPTAREEVRPDGGPRAGRKGRRK